jgi:hypothetical protein
MIQKVKGGYKVLSEKTGKNLGGPYKTKAEAEKRLRQVELFSFAFIFLQDALNLFIDGDVRCRFAVDHKPRPVCTTEMQESADVVILVVSGKHRPGLFRSQPERSQRY